MAFLAPAAAGAVSATAGASALAGAAGASSALGAGLTAGTALGSGAAMAAMPALSYAGANLAAPGILGALPSAIAPTAGIFAKAAPALAGLPSAVAPTAGIFSKAMPALAGLPSVAPAAPGIFSQAAPALGGLKSFAPLAQQGSTFAQVAPNLVGRSDVLNAFQQAQLNPFKGAELGKVAELGKTSTELVSKTPGLESAVKGYATSPEYLAQANAARDMTTASKVAEKFAAEQAAARTIQPGENFLSNFGNLIKNPSMDAAGDYIKEHPYASAGAAYGLYSLMQPKPKAPPPPDKGMIRPYEFAYNPNAEAYAVSPTTDSREQVYFNPTFTAREPIKAAEGGIMALAVGGPVEQMAAMNAVGANTGYPMAGINTAMYSNPMVQRPEAVNVISPSGDAGVSAYSGEPKFAEGGSTKTEGAYKYSFDPKTNTFTQLTTPRYVDEQVRSPMGVPMTIPASTRAPLETGSKTAGGIAAPVGGVGLASLAPAPINIAPYQTPEQQLGLTDFYAMMDRRLGQIGGYAAGGGISNLGDYSDGGRLLKGPGDGVSDSIPAVIGNKQPARLADGEFVIPARIVSELGNGSTEAGARKLYAMMNRVQKARSKTVGKNKVAANTRADKHLPA